MRIEEERFYPDDFMPPWVRYQHLERYRWAAKFVAGKRVLDVACGTGYGTAILANAGATQVDGFDCSPEAVAFARKDVALAQCSVRCGDSRPPARAGRLRMTTTFRSRPSSMSRMTTHS